MQNDALNELDTTIDNTNLFGLLGIERRLSEFLISVDTEIKSAKTRLKQLAALIKSDIFKNAVGKSYEKTAAYEAALANDRANTSLESEIEALANKKQRVALSIEHVQKKYKLLEHYYFTNGEAICYSELIRRESSSQYRHNALGKSL